VTATTTRSAVRTLAKARDITRGQSPDDVEVASASTLILTWLNLVRSPGCTPFS
jgi:hypothetical protein